MWQLVPFVVAKHLLCLLEAEHLQAAGTISNRMAGHTNGINANVVNAASYDHPVIHYDPTHMARLSWCGGAASAVAESLQHCLFCAPESEDFLDGIGTIPMSK